MKHEQAFKIPIPGTKKNIYAKQYGELDQPVVVFVHGLTGFMDEHQFYNGARYFHEQGFSSLRFNLYDYFDDARDLIDCTLKTHAEDVNTVVNHLKENGAEKIFAAGHSYGGPSVLLSKQEKFAAVALWDGTNQFIFDKDTFVKGLQGYYLDEGPGMVTGKAMYEEARVLDWNLLFTGIRVPVKFIWAENEILAPRGQQLFEKVSAPKDQVVLKGVGHIFAEEGAAVRLFDETVSWFNKFI